MLLSIVIVTRNRANELKRTVDSCLKNINVEHELVIIDNSSLDNTQNLIESYRCKGYLKNIRYQKMTKNLGVAQARNIGYEYSTGKYVLFIDDDAVLMSNKNINDVLNIFDKDENVSIVAAHVFNPQFPLWLKPRLYKNNEQEAVFYIGAGHIICKERVIGPLYPKSLFYGHEDLYLSLKNCANNLKIFFDKDFIIYHYPSKYRFDFEKEQTFAIVNKYAVKRTAFPVIFSPILYYGFLKRNILFWKWRLNKIIECHHCAKETIKNIKGAFKMSHKQAIKLLNECGWDFLWEISNTKANKKILKK